MTLAAQAKALTMQKVLGTVLNKAFCNKISLLEFMSTVGNVQDLSIQSLLSQLFAYGADSPEPLLDLDYLNRIQQSFSTYQLSSRPPQEVFWPDPTRPAGWDIKTTLPFSKHKDIINKKTRLISFGSCFASEIGRRLLSRGYNYVFTQKTLPLGVIDNLSSRDSAPNFSAYYGILFNSLSLDYIVKRASSDPSLPRILLQWQPDRPSDDRSGLYVDPFREGICFTSREAYEHEYPIHTEALYQALSTADVIIWTFGLSEAWILDESDLPVSCGIQNYVKLISRPLFINEQGHFDAFSRFRTYVKSINGKAHFIVSVSPIPLNASFSCMHIISANALSKAQCMIAAHRCAETYNDTYYLPSFEYVTDCLPDPWAPDRRHVSDSTVDKVIDLFLHLFSDPKI